jgi:hypothetical protein
VKHDKYEFMHKKAKPNEEAYEELFPDNME